VNAFLALSMEVRLAILFALGLALGSAVNWAIFALAWFSRPISPWQPRHPQASPRRASDFVPVVGWLGLRREAVIHGKGFWIRPLLLEIACGIGLAALYWWEVNGSLAPPVAGVGRPPMSMLHHEFASHAILLALMLVATFIDFDEKTIPDEITIPGTLAGLLLAAIWPDSALPVVRLIGPAVGALGYVPLLLTSTDAWPAWLDGWRGAALGVGIFVTWCVVLIPALCTLRRGWRKGIQYYFASAARGSAWWKMLLLAVLGSAAILLVWASGGSKWQALLSALVGLAFGGGMIWAVRITGTIALHKEAMGFGDVTLMAMIGSFLGWQACLMIFFLSPFAALLIAVAQWLLTRRRDIAFGPYLCLAALIVIVRWPDFWEFAGPLFREGWLLPALLAVCLVLMMGLLMLWRIIEQTLFGGGVN
jgi:prepilin signal peptidase PulO-like enzyme (type II secretory pathway)